MIDMALERDLKMFFRQPIANEDQSQVLDMMKHPRSVITFSDSGPTYRRLWIRPCRRIC